MPRAWQRKLRSQPPGTDSAILPLPNVSVAEARAACEGFRSRGWFSRLAASCDKSCSIVARLADPANSAKPVLRRTALIGGWLLACARWPCVTRPSPLRRGCLLAPGFSPDRGAASAFLAGCVPHAERQRRRYPARLHNTLVQQLMPACSGPIPTTPGLRSHRSPALTCPMSRVTAPATTFTRRCPRRRCRALLQAPPRPTAPSFSHPAPPEPPA